MINMVLKNLNSIINNIGVIIMMKISVQKIFLICFLGEINFFLKMVEEVHFISQAILVNKEEVNKIIREELEEQII